jgi:predicted outer membrane repeat protein
MRGKTNLTKWLLGISILLLTALIASADMPTSQSQIAPEIIYVDDDATGANVGTSWRYAINSLQDALLLAYFMEKPVEIRVAEGTYTPDHGIGIMPGDKSASFQLMNGVTIKGGYAPNLSGGRGQPDVRDINRYESTLSGDLNADDGPELINIEDNSYHVLTASETDETAVLDGFTITGSGIDTDPTVPYTHSGGMYNNNSSPTLIDCTFKGNLAGESGAGMYNNSSNPILLNCTFSENSAPEGGSGMYNDKSKPTLFNCMFIGNNAGNGGAGMHNNDSNPILLNCVFSENHVNQYGGGMYNELSSPALTNCTFNENSAQDGGGIYNLDSNPMLADCSFNDNSSTRIGGAIHNRNSNPILLNCIFNGNSSLEHGGGMCNAVNSNPTLTNCTFIGNTATYGGAIDCYSSSPIIINNTIVNNIATYGGGICFGNTSMTVTNTILWNNSPNELYEEISGRERASSSLISVTYNNIKGGFFGEGNIDSDPLFADPANGDYHLKSQAGRWDPNTENWTIDKVSSLCIDAGDPNTPVGLERFPNGGRINMGTYGGTPEASLSHWQLPGFPVHAYNPLPANRATDVPLDVILSWTPGKTARLFNVYFGTDFETVYHANINNPLDVLVSQNQDPNTFSPGRLNTGQTYYWRVDEVDSDGTIITGTVWTFTTYRPPKGRACFTGRTPVWVNGAPLAISKVALGQSINIFGNIGKVEEVQEHSGTFTCYDILFESGKNITVAENHFFMADSGQWISLKELKAGTGLRTANSVIKIKSIIKRSKPYTGKVYNLKIEGSDRYLVGEDAVIVRDY